MKHDLIYNRSSVTIIRHTIAKATEQGALNNLLTKASQFHIKYEASASFEKSHWFFSLLLIIRESIDNRLQSRRKSED